MRRKPVISIVLSMVSMLLLLLISFTGLSKKPSRPTKISTVTPPTSTSAVPSVAGEIIAIKSTPDFSLVALVVALDKDHTNTEVLLFDPSTRTIIVRHQFHSYCPELVWSPDSHRLAAYTRDEKTVTLIETNGTVSTYSTSSRVDALIWYGRSNEKFLYYSDRTDGKVYLYDTSAQREKVYLSGYQVIGLSCVRGQPCMAYLQRNRKRPEYDWPGAQVMDLKKREVFFTVPFLTKEDKQCDDYYLELSPDGQYFLLCQTASGYAQTRIANCADTKAAMRETRYAIYFHGGAGVKLPGNQCWSPFMGQNIDDAESAMTPNAMLSLRTGNAMRFDEYPYYDMHIRNDVIDWWKAPRTFLYVNDEGLHLSSDALDAPALLRHVVW